MQQKFSPLKQSKQLLLDKTKKYVRKLQMKKNNNKIYKKKQINFYFVVHYKQKNLYTHTFKYQIFLYI